MHSTLDLEATVDTMTTMTVLFEDGPLSGLQRKIKTALDVLPDNLYVVPGGVVLSPDDVHAGVEDVVAAAAEAVRYTYVEKRAWFRRGVRRYVAVPSIRVAVSV